MPEPKHDLPRRVVVLASGSGTNLQVLIDNQDPAWSVVGVVTDRENVGAIARAAAAMIPHRTVLWDDHADRASFTVATCDAAAQFAPDYIVLAGYMRVLAPPAIQRFPNRIINIHPSLLPAFPGAHAVRDALEFGAKVTGVTIHFVDEHLDHGPIICQAPVAIVAGDDEESLHARIQAVEHRLLPQVVTDLALGHLEVSGRIVKGRVTT
jgi:phosphoribosylglycinamide formyltransferase-1